MKITSFFALLAACQAAAFAAPINIDWEDGQWKHGATTYTGWRQPGAAPAANTGVYSGTTSNGQVTVEWRRFGTASGAHSGIGGVMPVVNGGPGAGVFNGAGDDGALAIGSASDYNGTSVFLNYVQLSIIFAEPVDLSQIVLGDVDDVSGTAWQDLVFVRGFKQNSPVGVNYALSANQVQHTQFGMTGVLGVNNVNVAFDSENGNAVATFNGAVDRVDILYTHGPQGSSGNAHGIWLRDIEAATAVPEPSAIAYLAGPIGMFAYFRNRRTRK